MQTTTYRYQLETGSKKHLCPGCGKRRFVRYIDIETGNYLPEQYGRCDRAVNCAYHLNPYRDGYTRPMQDRGAYYRPVISLVKPVEKPVSFISPGEFHKSQTGYEHNHFYAWLCSLFHQDMGTALMQRFNVGTSRHWNGATVFWQVDHLGRVRTGKVMLYNPVTGKRMKEVLPDGGQRSRITWAHSILQLHDFNLKQCLFGLQQLKDGAATKPVAIVESEKTAIIATAYLPQFIWLACGSLTNLTGEKLRPVADRPIFLFPDLGAYESWQAKARELQKVLSCKITVSDLLEQRASALDKANGLDLADYLLKKPEMGTGWALTDQGYPMFWDNPLQLPIAGPKRELYRQSVIKACEQSGGCNVNELAVSIGIDLQTAVMICEELSEKCGYEIK